MTLNCCFLYKCPSTTCHLGPKKFCSQKILMNKTVGPQNYRFHNFFGPKNLVRICHVPKTTFRKSFVIKIYFPMFLSPILFGFKNLWSLNFFVKCGPTETCLIFGQTQMRRKATFINFGGLTILKCCMENTTTFVAWPLFVCSFYVPNSKVKMVSDYLFCEKKMQCQNILPFTGRDQQANVKLFS